MAKGKYCPDESKFTVVNKIFNDINKKEPADIKNHSLYFLF